MIDIEDISNGLWSIIKFVLHDFFINIILYYIGFIILRVVSFWKYPPKNMTEKDKNIVIATGFLAPIITFGAFFIFNNFLS